jgi:hypothetical protein
MSGVLSGYKLISACNIIIRHWDTDYSCMIPGYGIGAGERILPMQTGCFYGVYLL